MLALINSNRMTPPIAPVGLDYIADAGRREGVAVMLLDLCLAPDPDELLTNMLGAADPRLVAISLRNVDDCFWPSGQSFLPELDRIIELVRRQTDAPIVLGGVGFSIFAAALVERTGVEYGIRGDGDQSLFQLYRACIGKGRPEDVDGLIWRDDSCTLRANTPAWPASLHVPFDRASVDNATYFRLGGQIGLETKRGCPRRCTYCADPLAKGNASRLRAPADTADEVASLLRQGVDVLHLCDAEFNLPYDHMMAVCETWVARRLGDRIRWYAYLAVTPFDEDLAAMMARAGCVGVNFTSDSASASILQTLGQSHRVSDLQRAVRLCREHGIAVMLDMLLGAPGETPKTIAETIDVFRRIDPDCAGASLGVRLYPGTSLTERILRKQAGTANDIPGLRRHYTGPIDLTLPTFYIAPELGSHPARLVRELIGDDPRFFPPEDESTPSVATPGDHNYNANAALADAIRSGARGAYWDILRKLRR